MSNGKSVSNVTEDPRGPKKAAGRRKGGFGGRKKGENARFGRILKGDAGGVGLGRVLTLRNG